MSSQPVQEEDVVPERGCARQLGGAVESLGHRQAMVAFKFGGTSLLIVVSVTLDTVAQIQGHLLAHQYEGLVRRSTLKGKAR